MATAKPKPLEVQVIIEGKEVTMELDTGASISLVSEETFNRHWSGHQLQPTSIRLKTYSGEQLTVVGEASVEIEYENQNKCLPLVSVEGRGPSLFGRDWLSHFQTQLEEDPPTTAQFTVRGDTATCRCVRGGVGHATRIQSKADSLSQCKSTIPESPPSSLLDERVGRERFGSPGHRRHTGACAICRLGHAYIVRWRSLHDLHTEDCRPQGCINYVETEPSDITDLYHGV